MKENFLSYLVIFFLLSISSVAGVSGKGGLGRTRIQTRTRTRTRIRTRTPGTRKGFSQCCCATTMKGVIQDTFQDGMVAMSKYEDNNY